MPTPEDIATAERALEFSRYDLLSAGNPAWATVAVMGDGALRLGSLILANRDAAQAQRMAMQAAVPGALVLLVGSEQAGQHQRFTVLDDDGAKLLVRDQTHDEPIGSQNDEI